MRKYYSPSVAQNRVNLPSALKIFFENRGKQYDESLPSYEKIQGKSPKPIPEEITNEYNGFYDTYKVSSYPVMNDSNEYWERAEHHAKNLLARLNGYSGSRNIELLPREYMLNGHTKPIRLKGLINETVEVEAFVKKPSAERIFGLSLYNLLSDFTETRFVFNETVLIEEKVAGKLLGDAELTHAARSENFLESVIALDVIDEFISINDLSLVLKKGSSDYFANLILTPDMKARAFDFDCLFNRQAEDRTPLLEHFQDILRFSDKKKIDAIKDYQRRKLCRKAIEHDRKLWQLVKYMDRVPDLVKAVKENYRCKSVEEFFERGFQKIRGGTRQTT